MAACPEFHVGCRVGWEFFTLLVCSVHEPMYCNQKGSIIVWWWHQLLPGSLHYGCLSAVSHQLLASPRTSETILIIEMSLFQQQHILTLLPFWFMALEWFFFCKYILLMTTLNSFLSKVRDHFASPSVFLRCVQFNLFFTMTMARYFRQKSNLQIIWIQIHIVNLMVKILPICV